MSDQVALSRSEEKWLDEFAQGSEFWASIRAKYAEFDGLTEKQYAALKRDIERNGWKRNAPKLNGVSVRNKFTTRDGSPRCGHAGKPWCQSAATVVVGSFGYCRDHEDAAREALAEWKRTRDSKRDGDAAAEHSGEWGDEFSDGGGGSDNDVPF